MKRWWGRVAVVSAVLVVGSWWINAAFTSPGGWACDTRTTGFDGWPTRSTSLEGVLATVDPPEGAVMHDPERVSDDYVVQQYVVDGEVVQEVQASRTDGRWGIDSVSSC
jgi:hypothetical protein